MLLTTEAFDLAMAVKSTVATLAVPTGPLAGAKVKLSAAPFVPTRTLVIGDITLPTYAGYADGLPAFDGAAAYRRDVGGIALDSILLTFKMNDAVIPTQVYGYVITASNGTTVLMSELFDTAQSLSDALSLLAFVIQLVMTNDSPGAAQLVV